MVGRATVLGRGIRFAERTRLQAPMPTRIGPPAAALLCLVLITATAAADRFTVGPPDLYPVYLLPIALAGWCASIWSLVSVAILCAAVWLLLHTGPRFAWNEPALVLHVLSHATALLAVGALFLGLRHRLASEWNASRHDSLTGLLNVRGLHQLGSLLLANLARARAPVTLAYLDLDDFKRVNDVHGHSEGDRVLQAVANTLRGRLRTGDLVARLGGDEFAMLLPNSNASGAAHLLNTLHTEIMKRMKAAGWPVTATIGAVTYSSAPTEIQDMLRDADTLMYAAKHERKNQVRVAHSSGDVVSPRRVTNT